MEESWHKWHGFAGQSNWPLPKLAAESEESARADQGNHIKANEYLDDDDVLKEKMMLVAQFVQMSQFCCAYTGAGLSRASGIPDYASKAKDSIVKVKKVANSYDAEPTYAHCVIAAMERAGYIHHYVQQNHDGLPQKAGFPQHKINEIHGAWFDPSNPVVQFKESLRTDLFDWLLEAEQRTDLCLCLGTSLSGMNADRIANTAARRSRKALPEALGTVVINIQQTPLDSIAFIRVWAKLDDAFRMLAENLGLKEIKKFEITEHPGDVYKIPFNQEGYLDESVEMTWDLRIGAKVVIPHKDAKNYGCPGEITSKRGKNYVVTLEEEREGVTQRVHRLFGYWWIDEAIKGKVMRIPFVNFDAEVEPKK
eukprot:TRINITY_DN1764_c0_g1_i3.p1 TRINITY_DN1764_c0_g1~~TRINITY_DN1764_c0_g1_i3.p1  ORF type:complete len:366 (-),score=48.45 TRINITY_DN1764_c0_g1_i3:42-1139(-)